MLWRPVRCIVGLLLPFSHSVVSESLWHHELQHARLTCPSLSPGVCSNSCPLSRWCHPTISSSTALFSCSQSFPASGSFSMSWLFASDGQTIGTSAVFMSLVYWDFTYKWDKMEFIFLCLVYLTENNDLKVHPCCHKHSTTYSIQMHLWKIYFLVEIR